MDASSEELIKMSEKSHELAQKITPQIWAKQLLDLLK
jgi:hypothetical protein